MTAFPLVFQSERLCRRQRRIREGKLPFKVSVQPSLTSSHALSLGDSCFVPGGGFLFAPLCALDTGCNSIGMGGRKAPGMPSSLVRYFEAVGVAAGNSSGLNLLETE